MKDKNKYFEQLARRLARNFGDHPEIRCFCNTPNCYRPECYIFWMEILKNPNQLKKDFALVRAVRDIIQIDGQV